MKHQSKANYNVGNKIGYNTEVLKSTRGISVMLTFLSVNITFIGRNLATEADLQNFASFTKCMTKIDGAIIVDPEDLDLVMPMYNLI